MMKVSEIMTREVVTIRNSATVAEAVKLMVHRSVHALIVEKSHELDAYGVIAAGDIVGKVIAFGRDPKRIRVYEIMHKPCIVLNPDLGVEYAARLLTQANLHSAPVIQAGLLGIVSVTDILELSDVMEKPQEVELVDRMEQLSATARQICQVKGPTSDACAKAWAAVDALQAELAHQHEKPLPKTASELFADEYPEAFRDRD